MNRNASSVSLLIHTVSESWSFFNHVCLSFMRSRKISTSVSFAIKDCFHEHSRLLFWVRKAR